MGELRSATEGLFGVVGRDVDEPRRIPPPPPMIGVDGMGRGSVVMADNGSAMSSRSVLPSSTPRPSHLPQGNLIVNKKINLFNLFNLNKITYKVAQ